MTVAADKKGFFSGKLERPWGYVAAAVAGGVGVLIHWGLATWLGSHYLPWALYYIAVMVVEWWLGWKEAVLTAIVGLILGIWVDLPPDTWNAFREEAFWAHVLGYCGVVTTIIVLARATNRRGAELAAVIEAIPAGIYIGNSEGVTLCNSNALRMLGAKKTSELNRRIGDLGKAFAVRWPENGRLLREDELQFSRALHGETVIEEVLATNLETGEDVHLRSACAPILEHGQIIGAVAVNADITAQKRAAEALHQSEERLRLAMETAALGLYERDLVSNEVRLDANCRTIMGLAEGRQDPEVASRSLHPDDRDRVLALVKRAFDPDLREICGADFRILWPNGQVRWVAGRGRVVFDASTPPRPLKFVGVLQDITHRKQMEVALATSRAELERLVNERTAKLRDAMSELEHMSYSIVHDLRAPLRAIQGFAGLIAENETQRLGPESRDLLARMEAATRRMDLLITDALNYNKAVREELPLNRVAIGDLLQGIIRSYPELQAPKAEITLEGPFPAILGNEAGLAQCFSNLLANAVKFVRRGTKPRVRVRADPQAAAWNGRPMVRIWVEDNGTGIPKGGESKIFQMFQRMHGSDYEGTGIGLALVRKVTERMGGRVGVESQENVGSRFWVEFARAEDSP